MVRSIVRRGIATAFAASLCLVGACAGGTGGATPVELYPDDAPATNEYVISAGDMLSVQVFEQPTMSGRMPVRSDGKISVPLINEVDAAGKTPAKLAADIEGRLKEVVLNPRVTVVVETSKPETISVMGEVSRPGPVTLQASTGVADALAAAGGFTPFAHKDRIFVVRSTPKPVRIHFTYEALTRKVGKATTFRLRPGDIVVVE